MLVSYYTKSVKYDISGTRQSQNHFYHLWIPSNPSILKAPFPFRTKQIQASNVDQEMRTVSVSVSAHILPRITHKSFTKVFKLGISHSTTLHDTVHALYTILCSSLHWYGGTRTARIVVILLLVIDN